MKFLVVWNSTLEVCSGFYESDAPDYGRFGGPMGSATETTHLALPEGLDPQCLMAVSDPGTGTITLQEDPQKIEDHKAALWSQLRTERNARLAASDWTQLQDSHLSAEKKSAWADYRQALRDLPDEVTESMLVATSPSDSVPWPLDPTQAPPTPVSGSRLSSLLDAAQ
jgi:hypothetical protein